jgi:AcrR family transcriptional regulator
MTQGPMTEGPMTEGLRERKKRETRRLISDTATRLFLERGFEQVTVVEVARVSGVAEKTVYNYFPTKESLLLDREDGWTAAITHALGPDGPAGSPVAAAVAVIDRQLAIMYQDKDTDLEPGSVRQVAELIQRTPALRAANIEMTARVAAAAAAALAARAGVDPGDPEPQITAEAIIGLWRVQFRSMARHAAAGPQIREKVMADVRRAAAVLENGL